MARALFAPRSPAPEPEEDDPVEADMRRMGAPAEAIEQYRAAKAQNAEEAESIEVHRDNWETAQLFKALDTQWRFAGLNAVRVGLDYPAVAPTAVGLGVEMTPLRFQEVRLMEAAALGQMTLNRKAEKTRDKATPAPKTPGRGSRRGR